MARLSALAVVAIIAGANALTLRDAKAVSGVNISCGTAKSGLLEHGDFIKGGPDNGVWKDFCKDFDGSRAKSATVQNAKGDVTLTYTPTGNGASVNECSTMFMTIAAGCAAETWEGPDSGPGKDKDVPMFDSGKGVTSYGTFAFSIKK